MKKSAKTKGMFCEELFSTEDSKVYRRKIYIENKGKNASCSLISL